MAGLFLSSFLSATLLPGNSELAFAGWLHLRPASLWSALTWVSLGNTLGGMTTYWLGTRLPKERAASLSPRALALAERWGAAVLLFSWLPILGDGLCLAAGWLRLPVMRSTGAMLLGKTLRYAVIALPWLYV
jgi:membrane protein YqaA with SNARE-associated domain